eukprot:gene16851-725_t
MKPARSSLGWKDDGASPSLQGTEPSVGSSSTTQPRPAQDHHDAAKFNWAASRVASCLSQTLIRNIARSVSLIKQGGKDTGSQKADIVVKARELVTMGIQAWKCALSVSFYPAFDVPLQQIANLATTHAHVMWRGLRCVDDSAMMLLEFNAFSNMNDVGSYMAQEPQTRLVSGVLTILNFVRSLLPSGIVPEATGMLNAVSPVIHLMAIHHCPDPKKPQAKRCLGREVAAWADRTYLELPDWGTGEQYQAISEGLIYLILTVEHSVGQHRLTLPRIEEIQNYQEQDDGSDMLVNDGNIE